MNENIRNVVIVICLCLVLIFGYLQREHVLVTHFIHTEGDNIPCNAVSGSDISPCRIPECKGENSSCLSKHSEQENSILSDKSAQFKKSIKLIEFLQNNLSSYLDFIESSTIKRCPASNQNNWKFDCTVSCGSVPFQNETEVREHAQVFIDCKSNKPIARFINKKNITTVQTIQANSKCLADYVLQHCYDTNPVPNIAHYIWFSKREMNFYHFLSFLSVSKYLNPCLIMVHGDFQPFGKYWNLLLKIVPNIVHVYRKPPESIFGIPLANIEHKADIGRIQALEWFGGIYLDTDEIILRSLSPLRKFPFTLSHALDNNLSNGLILSEKNAAFLKLWLLEYKTYTKSQWAHHSTIVPNLLSKKYPDLIHIENKTFVRPNYTQLPLLFKLNFDWSKNYAIHLYIRFYHSMHDFNDIRHLNTTMGSVARYVVYGTKELCEK